AVADFNGDGPPALAVTNGSDSNTLSVLLGNGEGTFQVPRSYAVGSSPRSVAAGDFDGDGHPDLAVTVSSGRLDVLLGGGGTLQAARPPAGQSGQPTDRTPGSLTKPRLLVGRSGKRAPAPLLFKTEDDAPPAL